MPTTKKNPSKTKSLSPKAPSTIEALIDSVLNDILLKAHNMTDSEKDSRIDRSSWKREDVYKILHALWNDTLRKEIKKLSPKYFGKDTTEVLFDQYNQLKSFIFILASDPHKHYNLSYYNNKIKELSNQAIRANRFIDDVFLLLQTLIKLIDFSKFHDNLYVSIDKFLLIGYNKQKNELTFDVNVKKFDSLLHVRQSNKLGLGLLNFDSVIYYRECELPKEDEIKEEKSTESKATKGRSKTKELDKTSKQYLSQFYLGVEIGNMATLFGLLKK